MQKYIKSQIYNLTSYIMLKLFVSKSPIFKFSTKAFDVAVIGGGPGGYVAAIKAAQLGFNTVCIQKRGSLGGTCLNVGCIPSKALLNISHKVHEANHDFKAMGIEVNNMNVNWGQTQKNKQSIVTSLTKGIQGLFRKNKVTYLKGSGQFVDATTIKVSGIDGNTETIKANKTIIATGSQANAFPGLPFDQKVIVSSTGALSLPQIPKQLIVVGGGVIGLELGSVYQRLGTKVTVIQYFDEICPFLDGQVAKNFHKILTKQGIKILTGHKVLSGKNHGNHGQITIQPVKGGQKVTLKADHILISTGRKPHTEGLGAQNAGVKLDQKGRVVVNDHLQTNANNIWAIGDVVRGAMLAHKAEEQGIYVAETIAGKHAHINYNAIPSVIYTYPEVASVGQTQQQLKKKGVQYAKGVFPFLANSRAKAISNTDGLVKILSDKKTDRILGAHIIGPGAGEMISEAVIGIQYGASSEDLARTCHAHPTLSQAFKEACMAAYDKPIHF